MLRPALFLLAATLSLHAQEGIEFSRDIRPILSDTCFQCHGPDKAKLKAGLRFDVESSARPALDEVLKRITTTDPDEHMPPPDFARQLKPEQIDTLKRWIAQGAPWQAHWAFIPPERPTIMAIAYGQIPGTGILSARRRRGARSPWKKQFSGSPLLFTRWRTW